MEGQPLYKIGDVLKPSTYHMGYNVLPQALLLTDIVYVDTTPDLHWAYEYMDIATSDTGQTSCYRIDQWYEKVA